MWLSPKKKKLLYYSLGLLVLSITLILCTFAFFSDCLVWILKENSILYTITMSLHQSEVFKNATIMYLLFVLYVIMRFPHLRKIATNPRTVILGFLLLFLAMLTTFLGASYLTHGNIDDLWTPQIIAHAIKHGLVLHQNFYTPFGFLYGSINYISLLIIETHSYIFDRFDMIMISSLLFSFLMMVLFYLVRINTKGFINIPWIVLLYILSIVPQARNLADLLNYKNILWYGVYNSHLWSLLFLQITHLFCWQKILKEKPNKKVRTNEFLLFLTIQVLCAYLTFNYKFNFFISSCLAATSIFLMFSDKLRFKYIWFSTLLFLLLISGTSFLIDYSYLGYLKNIHHAISSRVYTSDVGALFLYVTGFFLIRAYSLIFSNRFTDSTHYKDFDFSEKPTHLYKLTRIIKPNKKLLILVAKNYYLIFS